MSDLKPGICTFVIKSKNRTCKFAAKRGHKYCAEHLTKEDTDSHDRIQCPYDPKHTVQKSKLSEHLKKCNNRPKPSPAHFSQDVNIKEDLEEVYETKTVPHKSIKDLAQVLQSTAAPIPISKATNPISTAGLGTDGLQNESLASLIIGLLKTPEAAFIELGAGKGGLSLCIARNYPEQAARSLFILIDRKNSRRKADASLRHLNVNFSRQFIDIKDLDLDILIPQETRTVVFTGKHLCGSATCLSLNAISLLARRRPSLNIVVVIATCCHQVCDWNCFTGREFFKADGLNAKDFDKMRKCSSWAVCRHRIPSSEEIGTDAIYFAKLVKIYIDSCRLKALKDSGFDHQYIEYTNASVSPENRAILATRWNVTDETGNPPNLLLDLDSRDDRQTHHDQGNEQIKRPKMT